MKLFYLFLFQFIFCQTQNPYIKFALEQYYINNDITIDSTKYSLQEKTNVIDEYYLSGDDRKLSGLKFYKSDTLLPRHIISKWLSGLYSEQHYFLLNIIFEPHFPDRYPIIMSLYKMKNYREFISKYDQLKSPNLNTHLAKLDALFKLGKYEQISEDSLYLTQKTIPLQLKNIHIKANYKLKNYNKIISLFRTLSTDDLTPETIFIGAQAFLSVKQHGAAEYFFNLYINNAFKTELQELQLAHYYLGLIYQEQDKIQSAEDMYAKAMYFNPNYTDLSAFIHQTLGGYYQEKKQYQKALDEWVKYLALLPDKHSNREATIERIEILREKAFLHKNKSKKEN